MRELRQSCWSRFVIEVKEDFEDDIGGYWEVEKMGRSGLIY